ncbi:MAG: Rrf2 family iron-sulfur cluster assembly transcriptional regulator [Psychroserpens sp.]|jgi:Rrf2 family iron-sulfur cluster assembly transcriptional regulator
MKITAQDEYGLRILVRIAKCKGNLGLSIPQLSELEGLSQPNVSKLTRTLRIEGLVNSTKGHVGGYVLTRPADTITVNDILKALSGRLFDQEFCVNHAGTMKVCSNSVDCSIRSLWTIVQSAIDNLLDKITLADLSNGEEEATETFQNLFKGIPTENKEFL